MKKLFLPAVYNKQVKITGFPVLLMVLILFMLPRSLNAQFENRLSIFSGGGIFKTIGAADHLPDPGDPSYSEPNLMPNFKVGYSTGFGIQYNFSRKFSLGLELDLMKSASWYYDASDGSGPSYNALYYEIYTDTINYIIEENGENELRLTSLGIGIFPRYYFAIGSKLNPFIYGGLSFRFNTVDFINHEYDAYERLGRLDELEETQADPWFTSSNGPGAFAGTGVDYRLSEMLNITFSLTYNFGYLDETVFLYNAKYIDLHALSIRAGVKLNLLKSKDF